MKFNSSFCLALAALSAPALAATVPQVAPAPQMIERALDEITPKPCTNLTDTFNLTSFSYVTSSTAGDFRIRVQFPDLTQALCRNVNISGDEYFVFNFDAGSAQPTVTVTRVADGVVTQNARPIAYLRAIASDPEHTFLKVYTALSDVDIVTLYPIAPSTVIENIERGGSGTSIPAQVEFRIHR